MTDLVLCPDCNKSIVIGDTFAEKVVPKYPKRAGNKLILKNGEYGDFYGCESFPKCSCTRYSKRGMDELADHRRLCKRTAVRAMLKGYE